MNESTLKNRLGVFLVLSHFVILLLVVLFWLLGSFLTNEMTTAVAIIAPFFATYTTAIIRHVVKTKNRIAGRGRPVTPTFVFLAFVTPALFVLIVTASVILKGMNIGLSSFDDFKIMLGAAETIFGVYVGQFVFSLFESPESGKKANEEEQ